MKNKFSKGGKLDILRKIGIILFFVSIIPSLISVYLNNDIASIVFGCLEFLGLFLIFIYWAIDFFKKNRLGFYSFCELVCLTFILIYVFLTLIFYATGDTDVDYLNLIILTIVNLILLIFFHKKVKAEKIKNKEKLSNLNEEKSESKTVYKPYDERFRFRYKAEWAWTDAADEYLKKTGKTDYSQLSEEENEKIFGYASMPMVYFAMWLVEKDLLSEDIWGDTNDEYFTKMKSREISPLEILETCSYDFATADIDESILPFVCWYFYDFYINTDYPEYIKNDDQFYYCVDFSWEAYDKLAKRIDYAYSVFLNKN